MGEKKKKNQGLWPGHYCHYSQSRCKKTPFTTWRLACDLFFVTCFIFNRHVLSHYCRFPRPLARMGPHGSEVSIARLILFPTVFTLRIYIPLPPPVFQSTVLFQAEIHYSIKTPFPAAKRDNNILMPSFLLCHDHNGPPLFSTIGLDSSMERWLCG